MSEFLGDGAKDAWVWALVGFWILAGILIAFWLFFPVMVYLQLRRQERLQRYQADVLGRLDRYTGEISTIMKAREKERAGREQ